MYVALEDLALDHLAVIYPGERIYPLAERHGPASHDAGAGGQGHAASTRQTAATSTGADCEPKEVAMLLFQSPNPPKIAEKTEASNLVSSEFC